ncbi:hypothetical protein SSX86_012138 [Deinandra increscens subsp. villosa]|uniref:Uncharacterized protein n=1 Tax=Deinandra increscens subsp. villosa TaxID=3103831 RepID=A0AAP0D8T0_9ASTR
MATVPAKHQQPLHNFSLPFLKWGQRIQVNNHCRRRHRNSPPADSSDSDLHNRRKPHRSHNGTIGKTDRDVSPEKGNNGSEKVTDADDGDVKPWNLRPRRLVIDADDRNNGAAATVNSARSGRLLRGSAGAAGAAGSAAAAAEEESEEQRRKRRLWISLSKEEIEEDVYAFTGSRPARRPKKRNRTAQKQVDNVFPGLYLVGISADSYRV